MWWHWVPLKSLEYFPYLKILDLITSTKPFCQRLGCKTFGGWGEGHSIYHRGIEAFPRRWELTRPVRCCGITVFHFTLSLYRTSTLKSSCFLPRLVTFSTQAYTWTLAPVVALARSIKSSSWLKFSFPTWFWISDYSSSLGHSHLFISKTLNYKY